MPKKYPSRTSSPGNRPASKPPRLIDVYDDKEYSCVYCTLFAARSVRCGAIARSYPAHGMSARRQSIVIKITSRFFGMEGAAATGDVAGAALVLAALDAEPEAIADPRRIYGSCCMR